MNDVQRYNLSDSDILEPHLATLNAQASTGGSAEAYLVSKKSNETPAYQKTVQGLPFS